MKKRIKRGKTKSPTKVVSGISHELQGVIIAQVAKMLCNPTCDISYKPNPGSLELVEIPPTGMQMYKEYISVDVGGTLTITTTRMKLKDRLILV